jgi:hypothetical protein
VFYAPATHRYAPDTLTLQHPTKSPRNPTLASQRTNGASLSFPTRTTSLPASSLPPFPIVPARKSRDRRPFSAASANNTKNCLASWLHSAKTEAIACRSKVIAGRIYDAGNFVAPSNVSRNFSEMSRVDFTREDLQRRSLSTANRVPRRIRRPTIKKSAKALLCMHFIANKAGAINRQCAVCRILAGKQPLSPFRIAS